MKFPEQDKIPLEYCIIEVNKLSPVILFHNLMGWEQQSS
jgi:hypothetical protein